MNNKLLKFFLIFSFILAIDSFLFIVYRVYTFAGINFETINFFQVFFYDFLKSDFIKVSDKIVLCVFMVSSVLHGCCCIYSNKKCK